MRIVAAGVVIVGVVIVGVVVGCCAGLQPQALSSNTTSNDVNNMELAIRNHRFFILPLS